MIDTLTLTWNDLAALSPQIIILLGALLLILLECFAEPFAKKSAAYITLITLLVALHAAFFAPASESPLLTPWLRFDALTQLFTIFFISIGIAATLLSTSFFQRFEAPRGEYFFLLLAALFGLLLIGSAADFLTLFLGIETLSISLYVLCGCMKAGPMRIVGHQVLPDGFCGGGLSALWDRFDLWRCRHHPF